MPQFHLITHNGTTRSLTEWSQSTGLNYQTLRSRIAKGWSFERAILAPPSPRCERCKTHGYTGSKEYKAWLAMKCRCSDSRRHNAHRYVGRGITVCAGWKNDFRAFFGHVGPAPSRHHSLGRIDNDLGYEPGNVRWETACEQARNRG